MYRFSLWSSRSPIKLAKRVCGPKCLRNLATATTPSPTLPLAGIRVLDMSRVLAGVSATASIEPKAWFCDLLLMLWQPYCTQILGDLG